MTKAKRAKPKRKAKKPRRVVLGNDPVGRLYAAVVNYVEKKRGSIVVIGGVEIQEWDDGAGKFRVAVRCLGRKPEKPE